MRNLLIFGIFMVLAGGAIAEDFIESFDDPLGGWRDRWLAVNTNMQNYYVANGNPDEDYRGNNSCGLWIHDGDISSTNCTINFDASFGAPVVYFEIAIEAYTDFTLTVYDSDGNMVDTIAIAYNAGGGLLGCECVPFGFNTPNGLGYFTMESTGTVEGNTAIDDVKVTTDTTASVETTWGAVKALYR